MRAAHNSGAQVVHGPQPNWQGVRRFFGSRDAEDGADRPRGRSRSGRPRDREGSFEPQLVRKRQTRPAGLDDKVLGLYAGGMTVRDIAHHLSELYGTELSPDTISRITDAVLEDVARTAPQGERALRRCADGAVRQNRPFGDERRDRCELGMASPVRRTRDARRAVSGWTGGEDVDARAAARAMTLAGELGARLGRLKGAGPKIRQLLSMVQLDRAAEGNAVPAALGALPDGARGVDLVTRTAKAAHDGRWQTTRRFWNGPQLLVIDELGYLPMPGEAASHLFQVISRRYEHGSIILTTNRGIASRGEIFEDTPTVAAAILDRLLHHATVLQIDGDSYRMRSHRARLTQLRAGLNQGGEIS